MAAAAGLPNATLGAIGSQRGNAAAAMGGAGGGAGGGAACSRESLLVPSVSFITPKTREGASIEGMGGKHLFKIRDREKCRGYFQPRILIDNELTGASPGVYTWILKDIPDCGRHLFAIRTVIRQEVGTLHNNLNEYTRGDKTKVIIAGELRIHVDESGAKHFEFNKMSGSFSKDLPTNVQDARMRELVEFAKLIGIDATLTDALIINSEPNSALTLPAANLEKYEAFCMLVPFDPPPEPKAKRPRTTVGGARRTRKRKSRTRSSRTRRCTAKKLTRR